VTVREFSFENFAGDIEYHPRRAVLYLSLASAALCFWAVSPSEKKFTAIPLVFALGVLPFYSKAYSFCAKSSEGLGLSKQELANLSGPTNRKRLPSIATLAAQIVQDFGTGAFLLLSLLNVGKDVDNSWNNPPRFPIFLTGAILFFLGWLIRCLTSSSPAQVHF
jgi:hypothetical protein